MLEKLPEEPEPYGPNWTTGHQFPSLAIEISHVVTFS